MEIMVTENQTGEATMFQNFCLIASFLGGRVSIAITMLTTVILC